MYVKDGGTVLSTQQAAEALGVSRDRVRSMSRRGSLPAKKVGGWWLVDKAAVQRLAAARKSA